MSESSALLIVDVDIECNPFLWLMSSFFHLLAWRAFPWNSCAYCWTKSGSSLLTFFLHSLIGRSALSASPLKPWAAHPFSTSWAAEWRSWWSSQSDECGSGVSHSWIIHSSNNISPQLNHLWAFVLQWVLTSFKWAEGLTMPLATTIDVVDAFVVEDTPWSDTMVSPGTVEDWNVISRTTVSVQEQVEKNLLKIACKMLRAVSDFSFVSEFFVSDFEAFFECLLKFFVCVCNSKPMSKWVLHVRSSIRLGNSGWTRFLEAALDLQPSDPGNLVFHIICFLHGGRWTAERLSRSNIWAYRFWSFWICVPHPTNPSWNSAMTHWRYEPALCIW